MYFPQAFSPPLPDPAGGPGGRGRTRSHHERDIIMSAGGGGSGGDGGGAVMAELDDPIHDSDNSTSNNDSIPRRPCKSDSDIAIACWTDSERKQPTTADIFPPSSPGHDRTRQQQRCLLSSPPYPGIDQATTATGGAFDSGASIDDEMDAAHACDGGGGGGSFLGFGFDDPFQQLGDESAGVRGRTRSASYHQEADGPDSEGEGDGAAGEAGEGAGSCCDLGWGDATDFGEEVPERSRGRGEEEEEDGADADDLGSR